MVAVWGWWWDLNEEARARGAASCTRSRRELGDGARLLTRDATYCENASETGPLLYPYLVSGPLYPLVCSILRIVYVVSCGFWAPR